jgi:uncharacterized membrane protein affecting hemolysin expression
MLDRETDPTMLRFCDYSIPRKLAWMNLLVSGAALLLACGAFVAYDLISFRESMVRNLSIQAQIVGSNSVSALLFNDPQSARKTLSALSASPNVVTAGIYTADGRPFAAMGVIVEAKRNCLQILRSRHSLASGMVSWW